MGEGAAASIDRIVNKTMHPRPHNHSIPAAVISSFASFAKSVPSRWFRSVFPFVGRPSLIQPYIHFMYYTLKRTIRPLIGRQAHVNADPDPIHQ